MSGDGVREEQGEVAMDAGIRMHHITTELLSCGRVDPDEFREAFEELGFWEEDFPADGFERMVERFDDMGVSAWRRFVDLTIALNEGSLDEMMYSRDDGGQAIPYAVLEAGAVVPMDFDSGEMDRAELRREAMRRLALREREGGFSPDDL